MNEDYVNFEVAKLLKEKGFDWKCDRQHFEKIPETEREEWDEVECLIVTKWNVIRTPIPTLWQAQKWLREEKGIETSVAWCRGRESYYYWFGKLSCHDEDVKFGYDFPTYEAALSAGIETALKLI